MNKKSKIIARRINTMARIDQAIRKKMHKHKTSKWNSQIDKMNTLTMEKIIAMYGWPTIGMVGKKASHNAWLLVQHADHDTPFQEKCLRHIQKEFSSDPESIQPKEIAYLTDRIAIHHGKEQIFGTQFRIKPDGKLELLPLKNRAKVNVLRKKYGLKTLQSYLKWVREKYK
jgi:hypothetical protein